ncbi:MAG: hypothetical protein KC416_12460, partial [Myxococcales bacterium]|nr:hypothetical protein [Myxococcales bacterium]
GLEPRELAVGGVCLEGLAPLLTTDGNEPDGPVLLLNVEQTFTEFCTVENGRCTFARTLSEGVTDVATGRLEGALRRTMAAYRAAGGNVPTHGWLLGEGATDDHAPPWFTSKLDLPITPLALPEGPGAEAPTRPRFARAAALASYASIRSGRIDLRQKEFESKATDGFLQNHGGLLALAACAILISAGFSVAARWANLSSENQQLQARLESITETAFRKGTSNPEVARRLLDGKGGDEDPIPEFDAYDTLEMISSKIPPDIKHDVKKLTIELDDDGKEGRFELRGTVPSIAERDQVASLIGEHKCIHDLQKGTTSAAPGGAGVSYPLEATIRCSPEDPDTKKKKKKK